MNDKDFEKLVARVKQMGSILSGKEVGALRTVMSTLNVRGLRERLGLGWGLPRRSFRG